MVPRLVLTCPKGRYLCWLKSIPPASITPNHGAEGFDQEILQAGAIVGGDHLPGNGKIQHVLFYAESLSTHDGLNNFQILNQGNKVNS
jgi:hypothetical protein